MKKNSTIISNGDILSQQNQINQKNTEETIENMDKMFLKESLKMMNSNDNLHQEGLRNMKTYISPNFGQVGLELDKMDDDGNVMHTQ